MPVEYRIDWKSAAGVKLAEITDYRTATVAKQVNDPGRVEVALRADHPLCSQLADKQQVEVWRRWPELGLDWYLFHGAIFRDEVWETLEDGQQIVTLGCPGQLAILDWSLNAYAAGTANKTVWTSVRAETLMKQLVTNNCTSSATTGNGRDRTRLTAGALNGVTIAVQADAGGGNLVSYESARGNVLAELKRVWDLGAGGDFDLIKTGAAAWEFRFYAGQRGTDRSASVTFSTDYGTMGRPKLTINRTSERTAAIVAGQGQKGARVVRTRTGANYVAASNDVEVLVDGRNAATTAALDSLGDKKLSELRSRAKLSFTPLQTPARLLDRDYTLGDKVASRFRSLTFTHQIWAIQAALAPGRDEELSITLRDL